MKKLMLFMMMVALVILFAGCQSNDYYADKTVREARVYALKNLRFLTPVQRSYIEFNKPEILYVPVYNKTGWSQNCVVWHVPDIKKSIVVFGLGPLDLRQWRPYKVLLQEFKPKDILKATAVERAREYIVNKMVFLTNKDINYARFSPPRILRTTFRVSTKTKLIEKDARASRDLKMDLTNRIQISLVWNSKEKGRKIVVTGLTNEYFKDWVPVAGLLRSPSEILNNTVEYDIKSSKDVKK